MRSGGGHSAQRRLPGVETRNAKQRHCRKDLQSAKHCAGSCNQCAICHCLLCAYRPSLFFFIRLSFFLRHLRFLILPSLSSLFLFYFYFYYFVCIFMQLNKQNISSCTLQAPHVLPAHISVNRKQEQAETRSHPRCCLPHLLTVYPFSNQIPPSHGCPNGTTFKFQCSGL